MTRKQLFELRRKRKRKQQIRRLAIGLAVLAVLVVAVLVFIFRKPAKPAEESAEPAEPVISADVPGDTAIRMTIPNSATGKVGWNVNEKGWWYMNPDDTQYVSGWKTIDGQRYYFCDNGYLASGWVNTGDEKDSWFDVAGILDPTAVQKYCALTFDDGPSQNTGSILNALEQYGAKATFFVVGTQAEAYPAELRSEYTEGFEIGNHTYDNAALTALSASEIAEEMRKNDETISGIINFTPALMRPSTEAVNETVIAAAGKPVIMWDVETHDWETQNADSTVAAALENVRDGSIIRIHDLYDSSVDAVWQLVPRLQDQGYKLVTVSELARVYGCGLGAGSVCGRCDPGEAPSEEVRAAHAG